MQILVRGVSSSYLIIAVPSEESFLQYVVNGLLNMPPNHISRFSDKTLHKIAQIFPLRLVEIYHENLQKGHFAFFAETMFMKRIFPARLIDRRLVRRIIAKIYSFKSKIFKPKINAKDIMGHTVVAVYEYKA